ncbi:MAG: hypothetical protein ACTHZ5_12640 [Micrococcaceae bacterium]
MKKSLIAAAVSAGVGVGIGFFFWKDNERTKEIWSDATDSLDTAAAESPHN